MDCFRESFTEAVLVNTSLIYDTSDTIAHGMFNNIGT